mmetsp:Transcript_10858/g.16266  ORF Transcript_10858/g.16266 Transcript_10858/m.16266 type:complete len:269 (+) Transcript_10858:290-1096(+)
MILTVINGLVQCVEMKIHKFLVLNASVAKQKTQITILFWYLILVVKFVANHWHLVMKKKVILLVHTLAPFCAILAIIQNVQPLESFKLVFVVSNSIGFDVVKEESPVHVHAHVVKCYHVASTNACVLVMISLLLTIASALKSNLVIVVNKKMLTSHVDQAILMQSRKVHLVVVHLVAKCWRVENILAQNNVIHLLNNVHLVVCYLNNKHIVLVAKNALIHLWIHHEHHVWILSRLVKIYVGNCKVVDFINVPKNVILDLVENVSKRLQ